eukprot:CAMPEP_0117525420 /NCGR_PEP_ID=MMETSP0784-20121206/35760_1 /TAXON_ID=39447 /ORGANISM="" /LENGTH=145 /DNA_ID=CAMNT_0005321615 /DNA_START=494 /DNA_END=929 /DNA_ORIENTATION=+
MTVNGCMLAQQQVEIQRIKANGYSGPPPAVISMLPACQQSLIKPPQQQMGGMGGMPIGAPAHGGYGNGSTLGRNCENLEWFQLRPNEREAAGVLGLNQYMWDNDMDSPLSNHEFRELSPEQQQAAMTLGFLLNDGTTRDHHADII